MTNRIASMQATDLSGQMSRRTPMSGILRILGDAKTLGVGFTTMDLCQLQKNDSHANRQNNRNLVLRATEKGYLNRSQRSSQPDVYQINEDGLKFLDESLLRLSENHSIAVTPSHTRQQSSGKRRDFCFVPAEFVGRVPNSVFAVGVTGYQMAEMISRY